MDDERAERRIRFGAFEADLRSGELRKHGHRIRIQPQPFKVLAVLLESPGALVSRDELRKRLWPDELYVDFEHGLNRSINKLRHTLLDDASSPRYIETLSTRGYRFIAPVEWINPGAESAGEAGSESGIARTGSETLSALLDAKPDSAESQANLRNTTIVATESKERLASTHGADGHSFNQEITEEGLDGAVLSVPPAEKPQRRRVWWSALVAHSTRLAGFILIAGGLALLTLIVASAWRPLQPSARTLAVSQRLKPVPLSTLASGTQLLPAFSPDGSRIAYSWGIGTGRYLEVKDVNSDTRIRLTQRPADFPPGPAWSPDGRQIAFARAGLADDRGIFVISAMGGPERKLRSIAPWNVWQRLVSWSPDGRWIAFADEAHVDSGSKSNRRGPNAIFLISPDTSETRQLTQPPVEDYGDAAPTFSPDGATIAFVRTTADSHDEIYTIPVEGGAPHRLVTEGLWTNGLTWTADSKSIVFDRSLAGGFRLWSVSSTGSNPRPLDIPCEFTCLEPALWRDRLAYESHEWVRTVGRIALNGSHPELPATPVASTRHEWGGRYSPGGEHIAFISDRTGASELWMTDSEGANPVQLTHLGTPLVDLAWDPNGGAIAVSAFSGTVFLVSLQPQGSRLVFNGLPFTDERVPNIAFSRDGDFLYVLSEPGTGDSYNLLKVAVAGGTPSKVMEGRITNFAESMDGRTLLYSRADGLWKRPVEGGTEQLVAPPIFGLWDIGTDGLYLLNLSGSIERYSFSGKRLQTVAKLPQIDVNSPLSISPDGRLVLVGYSQRQTVEIDMVQGIN